MYIKLITFSTHLLHCIISKCKHICFYTIKKKSLPLNENCKEQNDHLLTLPT